MARKLISPAQRKRIRLSTLDAAANILAKYVADDFSFVYDFMSSFFGHYSFQIRKQRRERLNLKLPKIFSDDLKDKGSRTS